MKFIRIFLCTSILALSSSAYAIDYSPYMQDLIKLAKKIPQAPFAAMIIEKDTGKVLCEGLNDSKADPTWHGEIRAINNCAAKYPNLDWSKTALITTAEPCSMCMSAIVWANIPTVVYGTSIKYLSEQHWNQINIDSHEVADKSSFYHGTIIGGVDHQDTDKLFIKVKDKLANGG